MISIICQSHTCRRPGLISPVIAHATIKLLTHTLMQMFSALICICDLQTAIILQPPVAFWYNTRYIKTEAKRISSCPLRSVCFADWQLQFLKSSAHYCSGSETGREDWAFILRDIYSLLYQPVFFSPSLSILLLSSNFSRNLPWIIEDCAVPWDTARFLSISNSTEMGFFIYPAC